MPTLYHSAPILLSPDSIILPGNWGRILRYFGARHGHFRREVELEAWRARYCPNKPSRLESCFACPDEARLRAFAQEVTAASPNNIPTLLYEVEMVEPDKPQHVADWSEVEPISQDETYAEAAKSYWAGERWRVHPVTPSMRCAEVVTTSALRVLRTLD